MENKYLRHEALPIDNAARERVKRLVNEYAANSEGHPFGQYGDEIILQKYELCPIYEINLHSQYDYRPVSNKQYPYKGGSFNTRRYFAPSDVNVWDYKLLTTDSFLDKKESFEVPGSHHVETCGRCSGSGKVTCPNCGGTGDVRCSGCGGTGQIQKTRSEYRHTADKVYSDGHREPVYSWVNVTYYETCSRCGGSGRVTCQQCHGSGKVTCNVCDGYGKNVHCFSIDQSLYAQLSTNWLFINQVAEVKELSDQRGHYRGNRLFHERAASISKGIFTEEKEIGATLDGFIGEHAGKTKSNCHILFQDADVRRIEVWWVEYTYKGRTYNGCISAGLGEERFYAGVSPITELADKWLREARKKVGGTGTVKAKKLLEKVEKLNVYGRDAQQYGIQAKVDTHLNIMYNLGNDLMFWLIALVGTPFLYNFYDVLNPVAKFAFVVNDVNWRPYGWIPFTQCVLFLGLLWLAKYFINESDHSKSRHATVFGYVFTGMGLYLLIAVVLLAVLLGLNYLGLSAITSGIFWLAWRVLRIVLIIVFYALILAFFLLKWIGGLFVKLWHLLF